MTPPQDDSRSNRGAQSPPDDRRQPQGQPPASEPGDSRAGQGEQPPQQWHQPPARPERRDRTRPPAQPTGNAAGRPPEGQAEQPPGDQPRQSPRNQRRQRQPSQGQAGQPSQSQPRNPQRAPEPAPQSQPAPRESRRQPARPPAGSGGARQAPGRSRNVAGQQPGRPAAAGEAPLSPASIADVAETDVVTVAPDTPVATVVATMAEEAVGSVVVVENGEPTGILTDRSIALALETTPDLAERTAGELDREALVTGSAGMTVPEALDRLAEADVRRLPIVDEDGSLAGIVTLDDLLVVLGSELQTATEVIEAQSPRL